MKKRALILYWHGLGDVIQLTPVLRELYLMGYIIDLMCRKEVKSTQLFQCCPYISKFIPAENPYRSTRGLTFKQQREENIRLFNAIKSQYDWSGYVSSHPTETPKIIYNFKALNLPVPNDLHLELFIYPNAEKFILKYIKEKYPKGYIFNHTKIEFHTNHNWDSHNWILDNLPSLPIVDTGVDGKYYRKFKDINMSFVLAREAKHRVLSSSVFVHACDAMDVPMDIINYGKHDKKVWVLDQTKVKHIKECGVMLK